MKTQQLFKNLIFVQPSHG